MKQKLLNKLWLRVGMIVAIMTTALSGTVWADTKEFDFKFTTIGDTGWSNSYAKHTLEYTEGTVTFEAASKQTSTITTVPVTKGQPVEIKMKDGYTISEATFECQQWGTKAQTITLHYSTDGGSNYTPTGVTSTNFTISKSNLPTGTNAVKITFNSSSNQVGVKSATITYASSSGSSAVATTTTIDHSGITNTDVYTSTAAGSLSASVTAGGNAVAGATVSWSSSNTDVATIASDGTVTLVGAGSVTFTANYAGVANTYQESSDTYEMTVTDSTPIPTYTVTLGDDSSTLTEVTGGAGITLPSRSDVGIYTFAGWSATNVTTETTTAPTIIPVGTYNPTADITLYPVYTKTEGGASIETSNVFVSGSFENGIITWSIANVVSIKQEQNSGNTAPNSSYVGSPRWYSGNLITITPSVSINSISVTTTTDGYASALANSTFTNATASANGSAVTITPEDGSNTITITMGAQSRLSSLTVNYGGGTTYYYSTPVVKQENGILYVSEEYHNMDLSADGNCELNLGGVVANHGILKSEIVTESTTIDQSNYTWELQVLDVSGLAEGEGGIVVIRFWVEEDAEYYGIEKIVTAYFRPQPVIYYDGETADTPYGTPYTIDTDLIEGGDITSVSSSNTAVATVDGLTITPVAVGTTTITINTAAVADTWQAGTATFTLNVTAPEGKEKAAPTGSAGETIFEETFAGCESTGGNDDNFATAGNTEISTTNDYTDNDGWVFSKGYPADGCVKFGGSKAKGEATTPSITATVGTTYTLTFKAAPWSSESATMNVSVEGGTISGISEGAMSTGEWNDFTASITATATSFTVTFGASNNRFFLDEVKVEAPASPAPAITATLNGSGYATFCSQYPLDFSDYETAGYSAWKITGVSGETITFSQITGSIKGGQGILLKGTAGETVELTSVNSTNTLSGNLLEGTLAPKYVAAEQYYGLSGNEFVKVNAGTVPAGKALLPASALNTNVKAFAFVFEDDATGIEETLSNSPLKGENIYNLAGQMVNGKSVNGKLPKGIYIVNGKKVLK